jgi:hypothetical protein
VGTWESHTILGHHVISHVIAGHIAELLRCTAATLFLEEKCTRAHRINKPRCQQQIIYRLDQEETRSRNHDSGGPEHYFQQHN